MSETGSHRVRTHTELIRFMAYLIEEILLEYGRTFQSDHAIDLRKAWRETKEELKRRRLI